MALGLAANSAAWQRANSDHGVPLRWTRAPPMPVLLDPVPGLQDGGVAALAAAVSAWTAPACTGLKVIATAGAAAATPTNAVVMASEPWTHEPGDAAYTTVHSDPRTGAIAGARIELNPAVSFADDGAADRVDLQALLVHELGHVWGFGHSRIRGATLFAGIRAGSIHKRRLQPDDVAGLCAVYPAAWPTAAMGQYEPAPDEMHESGTPWLLLLGPLGLLLALGLIWRLLRAN